MMNYYEKNVNLKRGKILNLHGKKIVEKFLSLQGKKCNFYVWKM